MTKTTEIPTIEGETAEAIDRSYKAAFAAATPAGAKQPPTDVRTKLDEQLRQAHVALAGTRKASSGSRAPRTPKAPSRPQIYTKNGKPLARHTLSFAAYAATKGLGGQDVARVGVAELTAELKEKGVDEPQNTEWSVTLSNGVVLAATFAENATSSTTTEVQPAKQAAKRSSRKAPTGSTPVTRRSPKQAAKATARKATARTRKTTTK